MWIFSEANSPGIHALCETNLNDSIDLQFLCERLPFFNPKRFCHLYAWSCSLFKGKIRFAQDLSVEKSTDSYLRFWLALCYLFSYFFFLNR